MDDEEKMMCHALILKATRLSSAGMWMLASLWLSAAQQTTPAADNRVNLNDLIKETQKFSPTAGEILTVWWIPNEYWNVSFASNPNMPPESVNKMVAVVDSYTIIAVVQGKIGPFGGINYKSETEIGASLNIVDGRGQTSLPIEASAINADAKNLLAVLKPVMANTMGPVGENMHFFIFPGKDGEGRRLFDPGKDGRFTVMVGEKEFKWRLPLGSLLPAKTCPKCGETLSGAYKFCPWDGTALPEIKDPHAPHLPGQRSTGTSLGD